jgi:hypothetical protein
MACAVITTGIVTRHKTIGERGVHSTHVVSIPFTREPTARNLKNTKNHPRYHHKDPSSINK